MDVSIIRQWIFSPKWKGNSFTPSVPWIMIIRPLQRLNLNLNFSKKEQVKIRRDSRRPKLKLKRERSITHRRKWKPINEMLSFFLSFFLSLDVNISIVKVGFTGSRQFREWSLWKAFTLFHVRRWRRLFVFSAVLEPIWFQSIRSIGNRLPSLMRSNGGVLFGFRVGRD